MDEEEGRRSSSMPLEEQLALVEVLGRRSAIGRHGSSPDDAARDVVQG